jgi:hypothetical protein
MSPRPGWLDEALRELAEADAAAEAPARVERSLRAAFLAHAAEAERARSGPGRRRALTWWVAAAAAALALGSALLPREPPARAEAEAAFRPLTEGETWAGLDAVQIVRVRLTGAALAEFGGPVGAEASGAVDAEVILGQDGIARAIRIVE